MDGAIEEDTTEHVKKERELNSWFYEWNINIERWAG